MTRLKTAFLATAFVGSVAFAGIAAAEPGGWHHGDAMEVLHGVDLTDAQQAQVDKIIEAAHADGRGTWQQMHALHEQIATKLLTAGTTSADVMPLVQQEEQLRNAADQKRLAIALQIRDLLTPAQLAQAASKHQKLEALHAAEHRVMGDGEH